MQSFDPRSPPGGGNHLKREETRASKTAKAAVQMAVESDMIMPVLLGLVTMLTLTILVVFMAGRNPDRNNLPMPDTSNLAAFADPISLCHLTDDYTVRDGRAALRYNRRAVREEECSHKSTTRSKVVAAVSDCPFLIAVYSPRDDGDVDIVSSSIRKSGFWEPRESGMIADLPQGSVVVDVGANIGWHTLVALSLGHEVIAFEPLAGNLDLLAHSICLNPGIDAKLSLHKVALSDSNDGGCRIFPSEDNVGDGVLRCSKGGGGQGEEGQKVATARLDDMVPSGTAIDLLKIDVEGHELAVVWGGDNLFSGKQGHIKPSYVVSEFSPAMIREQGHNPADFIDFFFNRGYEVMFHNGGRLRGMAEAGWAPGQATGSHRADSRLERGGVPDFVRDLGMGSTTVEMSIAA